MLTLEVIEKAPVRYFVIAAFLLLATCASILVTDITRIQSRRTGDFEHFFYAADAMSHRGDPYAAGSRGYIYPPLLAFAYQPLARLGRDRAAAFMLAVNVSITLLAACLASIEFLRRLRISRNPAIVAVVLLTAILLNIDKVKGEWQMWQTDCFMLLMFVLALRWIDCWPVGAGFALGVAVNIKYLPLMFLPYLLIRRRWTVAAALLFGTLAFACLPAVSTGWNANLRNWSAATNGLIAMTGGQTASAEAAEVHDVKDSLSCSITSACARGFSSSSAAGFAIAAIVAGAAFSCAWLLYRKWNTPMFSPFIDSPAGRMIAGVEWVMLVAVVLAFGPQTNTRHLFDALIFTAAASAFLLFAPPGVSRWPLLIGTAILVLGFIFPPGRRTVVGEHTPTVVWLRMGGPCWCLLIAAFTLLWTGLKAAADLGKTDRLGSND